MFKFIHAADVHLDSPLRGLSRYESAPAESIRDACRRAFENLVDLAIEEKVALVLLAGDLYDGDWKDYSTGIFLSQQIGRLGKQKISVYAVAGNHDAANRMTKALDTPTNMTILSSRKVETIKRDDLEVAIEKVTQFMPLAQWMISGPRATNTGLWGTFTNKSLFRKTHGSCFLDAFKDATSEKLDRKDVCSLPSKTAL